MKTAAAITILDNEGSVHARLIDGVWVDPYGGEFDSCDIQAFEDIAFAGAEEWPPTVTNGGRRWYGMRAEAAA